MEHMDPEDDNSGSSAESSADESSSAPHEGTPLVMGGPQWESSSEEEADGTQTDVRAAKQRAWKRKVQASIESLQANARHDKACARDAIEALEAKAQAGLDKVRGAGGYVLLAALADAIDCALSVVGE